MIEVRFHGRGGQGTVVASILMAKAFFQAGYYVQSFPLFGVERRGAPVEAYLRLDKTKILMRTNVYTPDHVVVLDPTLLEGVDITRGLKPGGWILINAPEPPTDLRAFATYKLAHVDATRIAIAHRLGTRTHPIVNTAMMGAFARVLGEPPLETVTEAIREEVPTKPDANMAAAREAYESVVLLGPVAEAASA
ncbi:pyruvate ferredoxin oxidoreductase gamma subunit [Desulfacinum hydrothermale DSM 13146]|uniref:Pyruvate ferredoxin oxidoreductase gamma subunit n=1 Tax=Desulfacinum hydrothermale DSM 13146 TaxID=1121390 RepID=A0A1W1X5C4_9BACT|nr:2-oxoacid:acceptor oxidoreductase family protein [Desulfacinum hydrothermale]SMC18671.1 pyruvate ferredoxin oxidoreductase gamma subunit [Desulfacinum hydrothermale DSM 13146]